MPPEDEPEDIHGECRKEIRRLEKALEIENLANQALREELDDGGILYFAIWAQLSQECQDDLMHGRPGAIIRCTERDFGLLAPVPLSHRTLKSLQGRIMAARANAGD